MLLLFSCITPLHALTITNRSSSQLLAMIQEGAFQSSKTSYFFHIGQNKQKELELASSKELTITIMQLIPSETIGDLVLKSLYNTTKIFTNNMNITCYDTTVSEHFRVKNYILRS